MPPGWLLVYGFLAMAYESSGMYDEALAECQKSIAQDNNPNSLVELARIYAGSGRRTDAQRLLAEIQRGLKQQYSPPSHIAMVYVALNDKEQAFAWLEKAYEERDWGLSDLKVSPQFDRLRSDVRFSDLLKRMNLLPETRDREASAASYIPQ